MNLLYLLLYNKCFPKPLPIVVWDSLHNYHVLKLHNILRYIYISPFKRGEKVAMDIFMPKPKPFYILGSFT